MARKKTKQQKIQSEARKKQVTVFLNESGLPVVSPTKKPISQENRATKLSQSQVSLVYKDLLKTLIVTVVVFTVLLFIFVYLR